MFRTKMTVLVRMKAFLPLDIESQQPPGWREIDVVQRREIVD